MLKPKHYASAALIALLASTAIPPATAQESAATGAAVATDGSMAPTAGMELINQALGVLAANLLTSLPPTGTYAIKNVNDTGSGVPEDLLAQINSSLQSSLMVASDFQINLIDQGQQSAAWANAVEFNGADFEEIVSQSAFSALIIVNSRATQTGLELSLQAVVV